MDDLADAVRLSGRMTAGVAARAGEAAYRYMARGEWQGAVQVEVRRRGADEKRGNRLWK